MEATSTSHVTSAAAGEVAPACPRCRSTMVVRSQWAGGRVTGLYWGCRRAPGCEGARRIKSPDLVQPIAHDASTQAIFDWQSSREDPMSHGAQAPAARAASDGLRGMLGNVLRRRSAPLADAAETYENARADGYFDGLMGHGFVVIDDRSLRSARAHIDHLIIGPTGVFVVDRKAWAGHVVVTSDSVFVDGRERVGATDEVLRGATAFGQALDYELKPLGVQVRAAVLFERATNRSFEAGIGKVIVGGTRGLPKAIRGRDEPVLGPETILRLALAADRLLE